MINFLEMRKQHYKVVNKILDSEVEECFTCKTEVWPCEVITVLDEFELFIKEVKFNTDIVNSWIKDYFPEDAKTEEILKTAATEYIEDDSKCKLCGHLMRQHGKLGCNFDHNTPEWLELGCTCPLRVFRG